MKIWLHAMSGKHARLMKILTQVQINVSLSYLQNKCAQSETNTLMWILKNAYRGLCVLRIKISSLKLIHALIRHLRQKFVK